MAEGGFRQHHTRGKRTERHRQPAPLHGQGGTQYHQQGGRCHHLARPGLGQHAKQRVEQPAAHRHQADDGRQRHANADPARHTRTVIRLRRQKGHDRQQGHDGEVFEQQDGHHALATRCGGVAAFFEQLHHDGGGRQHKTHGCDERHHRFQPGAHAQRREQGAADHHLRQAQAEDLAPQRPEPGRLHLQPDDKQEHHHAKFGQVQDGAGLAKQAQAEGTDGQAGCQITQHRAQAQPLEQRHGQHARSQQHHHLDQLTALFDCHHIPVDAPRGG